MKSALFLAAAVCCLVCTPSAKAAHRHRRVHTHRTHVRHTVSLSRSRRAAFALRRQRRRNVINALLALPPRPITSLPAPPLGAPEFGVAIASSSPSPSTMQARLVRLRARHASLKRFPIAPASEPPSIATVQMAVLAPAHLPPPQRPAVWLNQPNPVPLPEPGAIGFPGPESPTIAPPQDEDDDQPRAWLTGAGSFTDNHPLLYRTCAFDRTANSGWLSFAELAPNF